jgi:F0F1-type ATP synthase alpha subunit
MDTTGAEGQVRIVIDGVARVAGLAGARLGETVWLGEGLPGVVLRLDDDAVQVALFDVDARVAPGTRVVCTGAPPALPLSEASLGDTLDPRACLRGEPGRHPATAVRAIPLGVATTAPSLERVARTTRAVPTGAVVIDALVVPGAGDHVVLGASLRARAGALALGALIAHARGGGVGVYARLDATDATRAALERALADVGVRAAVAVLAPAPRAPSGAWLLVQTAVALGCALREAGRDALVVLDGLDLLAEAHARLEQACGKDPGRDGLAPGFLRALEGVADAAWARTSAAGGGSLTLLSTVEWDGDGSAAARAVLAHADGRVVLGPGAPGYAPRVRACFGGSGAAVLPHGLRRERAGVRLELLDLEEGRRRVASADLGAAPPGALRYFSRVEQGAELLVLQDPLAPLAPLEQALVLLARRAQLFAGLAPARVAAALPRLCAHVRARQPGVMDLLGARRELTPEEHTEVVAAARAAVGDVLATPSGSEG